MLKKAGHIVRLGEFETCPGWVPGLDKRRRSPRISLKGLLVDRFDHTASWPEKVRNVSRLGRQFSSGCNQDADSSNYRIG
jgi:hypothetical protein